MSHRCKFDSTSIKQDFAENLKYIVGVDSYSATAHDIYLALSHTIRNRLHNQWLQTQRTHHRKGVKRVYYLSMEFLIGRVMGNNVINSEMHELHEAMVELGLDFKAIQEIEVDAGLGNGGLGRLAACFLDSMATLNIPAIGYGLRYDYGVFRQGIEDGYQIEYPDDWLKDGNPWEIKRTDINVSVHFGGRVIFGHRLDRKLYQWVDTETVIGVAHDIPIVGYASNTVNTLRLWAARASEEFNFFDFNAGEYEEAVVARIRAENLTRILYPNDTLYCGKELRMKQQYFFVACSLSDIVRRFKSTNADWRKFPEFVAIQLNDTHPSIAVAELMRILIDDEYQDWDIAWDITVKTMSYTNHTLMPEALEKWPVPMFEKLLPRHLQIIYEINHQFLRLASERFPGEHERFAAISIIEEGNPKMIRMAYLAIIGSHSINGVAALHTELLKSRLVPDLANMWPERFNNKTNGITQRRFLLKANPALSELLSKELGDSWITNLTELKKLHTRAKDQNFQQDIAAVKLQAKKNLSVYIKQEYNISIDISYILDIQIKRIHEYKRQLLNILHIIMLYNRIKLGKGKNMLPRIFMFAGKAAPGYESAKLIIKLINNVARVVNSDADVSRLLQVYFLPDYRVTLAEYLIPAADVSEQISTAGTEASGTGNMKLMANGALTIGTMDGANVEICEEVGRDNMFIFGLNAKEVEDLRASYDPYQYYLNDSEIKHSLDLLFGGHFDGGNRGIFEPIRQILFEKGDYYMHLADLRSYANAHENILNVYKNQKIWQEMVIHNIASCGKFSSDRTIMEYNRDIWKVSPCPMEKNIQEDALSEAQKL